MSYLLLIRNIQISLIINMNSQLQQTKKQSQTIPNTGNYQNKKYSENASKAKHQQPISSSIHSNGTNTNTNNHQSTIKVGTRDINSYFPNGKYASKKNGVTSNQPQSSAKAKINQQQIPHQFNQTDKNITRVPQSTFTFTFASKFKEEETAKNNNALAQYAKQQQQQQQSIQSVIKEENEQLSLEESDKKLKETLQLYNTVVRKNEGAGINTLVKLRTVLLNWLKDSDQDIEYSKFMTEKKIKYLLKNKEKMEARIKVLEQDLIGLTEKKKEIEKTLGEFYINYDEEELKGDIDRFENSYEVKKGLCKKTLEKLNEMKQMLPFVIENGKLKESEVSKVNEKKELEKILKGSNQTLIFLSNYYKNLKKKMNNEIGGNA